MENTEKLFVLDVENLTDTDQKFKYNEENLSLKIDKIGDAEIDFDFVQFQATGSLADVPEVKFFGNPIKPDNYISPYQIDLSVVNFGETQENTWGKISDSEFEFTILANKKFRFVFVPKNSDPEMLSEYVKEILKPGMPENMPLSDAEILYNSTHNQPGELEQPDQNQPNAEPTPNT